MNKYRSVMEKITVTPQMEERILTNLLSRKEERNAIKKQPYLKWIRYAGTCAACAAILCVLFLKPSIVNLNWGNQQIQTPKSADNSEEIVIQPEKQQTPVPESSENLGKTATHPVRLQAQAPGSPDNLEGAVTPPGGLEAQIPESSDNSEENVTQSGGSLIVNTKGIDELKKTVSFELLVPEKLPSGYKIDDTSVISGQLAQIIYSDGSNEITYRVAKGANDISGDYTSYEESGVVKIDDTEVTLKGSKSLINLATWIKDDCSYSLSFSIGIEKDIVLSIIENIKKA